MELILKSQKLSDYVQEIPPTIVFSGPLVSAEIARIEALAPDLEGRARLAFELARDGISHSFDTKEPVVSISAEETLAHKDGICFAKAHLLVALCRGMGIPAGFCYQRVLRKGTVESGYALHGLNALYLERYGWFRVDPRGNKPGIDSQFSPQEEKLAYPIRKELGEIDYPYVYPAPLESVVCAMQESADTGELFYKRPEAV